MPEFSFLIRIRPKFVGGPARPAEYRQVRVHADNGLAAQHLAIQQVQAENPTAFVSGHGHEAVPAEGDVLADVAKMQVVADALLPTPQQFAAANAGDAGSAGIEGTVLTSPDPVLAQPKKRGRPKKVAA